MGRGGARAPRSDRVIHRRRVVFDRPRPVPSSRARPSPREGTHSGSRFIRPSALPAEFFCRFVFGSGLFVGLLRRRRAVSHRTVARVNRARRRIAREVDSLERARESRLFAPKTPQISPGHRSCRGTPSYEHGVLVARLEAVAARLEAQAGAPAAAKTTASTPGAKTDAAGGVALRRRLDALIAGPSPSSSPRRARWATPRSPTRPPCSPTPSTPNEPSSSASRRAESPRWTRSSPCSRPSATP